jgi:serine/threonine-protein kinase
MDLIGLIAVMGAFAIPLYALRMRAQERQKRLEIESRRLLGTGEPTDEMKRLEKENKMLRERVENLETIVCSVDFELNAKLNRLASVQLQIGDAATRAVAGELAAADSGKRTRAVRPSLFELEPGLRLADRFVIQRAIGTGGMGAVYLASDERLGESIALKIMHGMALLDPAAGDRLRREASAARRISHPNVVKIHDVGEDAGHVFLSMEYVEGQSLKELIARHNLLPLDRVRAYVGEICAGLSAAHQQGVIHRDLKPANIIVMPDQRVKIIDFGLARIANLEGMTATGMLLGTPEYMAPEQIKGGHIDARTDLYSLGALTYHAITGRPPFSGDNPISVSLAHTTEQPIPPSRLRPGLSPEWDAFVLRALSKAKEDRFDSAEAMREALPAA